MRTALLAAGLAWAGGFADVARAELPTTTVLSAPVPAAVNGSPSPAVQQPVEAPTVTSVVTAPTGTDLASDAVRTTTSTVSATVAHADAIVEQARNVTTTTVTRVERQVAVAPAAHPPGPSASAPAATPPTQPVRSGVAGAIASTHASRSHTSASRAGGRSAPAHTATPIAAVIRSIATATTMQRHDGVPGQRAPLPPRRPESGLLAGAGGASSGGLLPYGFLGFVLLLVTPTAVRWLRPAAALGLSPAYVALRDRPG